MRILIGSVSYYPNISGVAISAHVLAKYLAKNGHQVSVIAPANRWENYTEKEGKNLTVFRLKAIANPFRQGFHVPLWPKKVVRQIFSQVQPDIVHLHDPFVMNIAIEQDAHKRNIPVIISNHFMLDYVLAYVPKLLHPVARRFLYKRVINFYNRCDVVICPTKTVVSMLRKNGVHRPMYALSNGVDIHRFYSYVSTKALRERYRIPNKPVVLYLGRIDRDKSIQVLLDAIPLIVKRVDAHVILAGGGNLRKKSFRHIKKRNLLPYVTMTGPIPHDEQTLVALYQIADVFTIPSTLETQSLVTMEAMAAGKPVVAARAGALPELVQNGENGFLFPPGDTQALADNVVKILQNKELRKRMSEQSLELIATHELNASLELFEELYERCRKNAISSLH